MRVSCSEVLCTGIDDARTENIDFCLYPSCGNEGPLSASLLAYFVMQGRAGFFWCFKFLGEPDGMFNVRKPVMSTSIRSDLSGVNYCDIGRTSLDRVGHIGPFGPERDSRIEITRMMPLCPSCSDRFGAQNTVLCPTRPADLRHARLPERRRRPRKG